MPQRAGTGSLWAGLRDGIRAQLWPVPTGSVVLAIALGVALPEMESSHSRLVPDWLDAYLFSGGADAARTVLDTVAGSLITVTSLTFSLTVVTLQLASSQFSPRLLRTFTRDLVVQVTLGLFLGTFAYALTVLRTVRTSSSGRAEFVPDVSITVAYALTVASVVALIAFLAHLTQTIRVESMLRGVHVDATTTLERELAPSREPATTLASLLPEGPSRPVLAAASGFLVRVRESDLLEAAVRTGTVVVVDTQPGDPIVAGTPVGAAWGAPASDEDWAPLAATIQDCLVTGFERTSVQDISLGLRQLTDVVVKALSPGVNDPTTAVHGLSHSSALLCELVRRDLSPRVLRDEQGVVRVVLDRPDLAALLRVAVDQPRRYGAGEPAVLIRLFGLLRELAWMSAPHQHPTIRSELERLRRTVDELALTEDVNDEMSAAGALVDDALGGRWDVGHRS